MSLDLTSVGVVTEAHTFTLDWRTLATYALGIGAKKAELDCVYENTEGGMKVLPTFAVVPAMGPISECLTRTKGDLAMVVHGAQTIRIHDQLPGVGPNDKLELSTTGKIEQIYDMKKFAQVILQTSTTFKGKPVFDTTWSIIYRGAGNFSGPRPPESPAPSLPKDRAPDFSVEESTSPEQALLYRISGDLNPLHADPVFAEKVGFTQGPILHGLCTFGFMGRALLNGALGRDPSKLKLLAAQFRKPVWPGDTLVTEGFKLEDGRIAITTRVKERNEAVLTAAYAELA